MLPLNSIKNLKQETTTSIQPDTETETQPASLATKILTAYNELADKFNKSVEAHATRSLAKACAGIVATNRKRMERGVFLPQLEDMDEEFLGRASRVYGIEIEELTDEHINNLNTEEQARFTGTWPEGEEVGKLSKAHKVGLVISSAVAIMGTVSPFLKDGPASLAIHTDSDANTANFLPPVNSDELLSVRILEPGRCAIQVLNEQGEIIQAFRTSDDVLVIDDIDPHSRIATTCLQDETPIYPQYSYADGINMLALQAAMLGLNNSIRANTQGLAQDRYTATAAQVTVAVIDVGFNTTHPELDSQGVEEFGTDTFGVTGMQVHGTMVASVISGETLGINPNARLATIAIPEAYLFGNAALFGEADLIYSNLFNKGLRQAVEDAQAKVVVISLGSNVFSETIYESIFSTINELSTQGVYFVFAAGNEGYHLAASNSTYAKIAGELPNVIFVGATDVSGYRAPFSNLGEVYAPGTDIAVAYDLPDTPDVEYFTADGTSFAAPIVGAIISIVGARVPQIFQPENYADFSEIMESSIITGTRNIDAQQVFDRCRQKWGDYTE